MDADIDNIPGLKRANIQKCCGCRRGVAHDGNLTFYRLRIERYILDARAIRSRAGLEDFFGGGVGGAALAGVMGPDVDLAKRISDEDVVLMCEDCAQTPLRVAVLLEQLQERKNK